MLLKINHLYLNLHILYYKIEKIKLDLLNVILIKYYYNLLKNYKVFNN